MRLRNSVGVAVILLTSICVASACSKAQQPANAAAQAATTQATQPALSAQERQLYMDAARSSWNFVNSITEPSTGLARAHARYSFVTLWDVAGVIAANYVARELGFINDATYDSHITRILATLSTVDLFENTAFNRIYDAKTGRMVDNGSPARLSTIGAGYSSVDIGRLLIWLRVISLRDPKYSAQATQIVRRINFRKVLDDGRLHAVDVSPNGRSRDDFLEQEIGYQQYALSGFAMWGAKVDRDALDVQHDVAKIKIYDVQLLTNNSGNDRVMSEPFIMLGIETGFRSPQLARQAAQVLAAQQARYQKTGIVTAVTEDAMPDPPYYFYYYSLWHNDRPFVVEGPGKNKEVNQPRWVSSKAAFGWSAVFPNPYTQLLLRTVQPARTAMGWGGGVYEGTQRPTGIPSLNTAAIIMESALFRIRGRPLAQ
ncbi:MAG TPA: DUF3131 domain-containing protein [Gemmatimonadaceae bacterium]|nr:DUF3131 domain-containing protein [Gemmatimonadaceae bacterium]